MTTPKQARDKLEDRYNIAYKKRLEIRNQAYKDFQKAREAFHRWDMQAKRELRRALATLDASSVPIRQQPNRAQTANAPNGNKKDGEE